MQPNVRFSVVSWNCLADCYSHGPCAAPNAGVDIVSWAYRSTLITKVLSDHDADIVCLQEVDHYEDHFKAFFSSRGYHVEYIQRSKRQDGVLIAFKHKKFELLSSQIVYFDDLSQVKTHLLQPLTKSSLQRQNIALILLLRVAGAYHFDTAPNLVKDRLITVCTTHLYWNPHFPQVKVAQTQYLLERLADMRDTVHDLPPCASLLTGDFNSEPSSEPYAILCRGCPFFPVAPRDALTAARVAVVKVVRRRIRGNRPVPVDNTQADETRFLCDSTLSKLARWLRLLGVDTAIEDTVSQERRAFHNDSVPLFDQARRERRVLITTSTKLLERNTRPETYLVRTSTSNSDLQKSLAVLLNHYEVRLNKSNFFSICGKCGGKITTTNLDDERLNGKFAPRDRQIYICQRCHQAYWWSDSTRGCSSRALKRAHNLFAHVKLSRQRQDEQENDFDSEQDTRLLSSQHVAACRQQWLRYHSSYSQVHGREPGCTNINGSYQGTLDYIFVGGAIEAKSAITQRHVSATNNRNQLFPNANWPSDHLLLRADVVLKSPRLGRLSFARTYSNI